MAYNRQPQTVLAGTALKQNPPPSIVQPAGIVPVTLDAEIATTTSLGVVQVGSGLSITPSGILSATGGSSSLINIKLTSVDYTASATDYYIGATKKDIDITLPLGITGKVYVIKNQVNGNIKVKATGGQKIDTSSDKTLGSEDSLVVVFDGTRWNVID
jgi:hypothetical protein